MKPSASHYRNLTAYRLAQAQHAEAVAFWRKFRRWLAISLTAALLIAAACRWPGATLAVVMVCLCLLALAGGVWLGQSASVGREIDGENE